MKPCAMLTIGLLAAALVPSAQAEDNEPEKLFRDLEKKIREAKAFEVGFTYQLGGKTTKGSLLLTKDNKARLKVSGPFSFGIKRDADFELVSDGKKFKLKGAKLERSPNGRAWFELGGETEGETRKAFHTFYAAGVSRVGVGAMVLGLPYSLGAEFDPDDEGARSKGYDFKAGAVEKAGERQAKAVHYKRGKGGKDDAEITLWIDTKTGLPLRRSVILLPNSDKIRITESCREVKLNPEVDVTAFELPK